MTWRQNSFKSTVCKDVEVKPTLQPLSGETLNNGARTSSDARLDIHARSFWERQRSVFFDVWVCHSSADSYREQTPEQIYRQHESEKKRKYTNRVLEVEQGTFTPLIFSTTGGMGTECMMFHKRLAKLLSIKKNESYATTMSWVRAKVSFALLRSALLCLRGSSSVGKNSHAMVRFKGKCWTCISNLLKLRHNSDSYSNNVLYN